MPIAEGLKLYFQKLSVRKLSIAFSQLQIVIVGCTMTKK
jgi:hypothetical protein